jgi:hypothetical protein
LGKAQAVTEKPGQQARPQNLLGVQTGLLGS